MIDVATLDNPAVAAAAVAAVVVVVRWVVVAGLMGTSSLQLADRVAGKPA